MSSLGGGKHGIGHTLYAEFHGFNVMGAENFEDLFVDIIGSGRASHPVYSAGRYEFIGNFEKANHQIAVNAGERAAKEGNLDVVLGRKRRKSLIYLIFHARFIKGNTARNFSLITKNAVIGAAEMGDKYGNINVAHESSSFPKNTFAG